MKRLTAAGALVAAVAASTAAAVPDQVTLQARPTVLGPNGSVSLFGSIDSGKADEVVTIQAKDCGASSQSFREVAESRTREGGSWSTDFLPGINTTLRAVWNNTASAQVTVRERASVRLVPRPSGRGFTVTVIAKTQFWRKRILFQRFDRRLGIWKLVKPVVLTETGGSSGSGGIGTWAEFRASVPTGTLVRALLPRAQARPCYLAGVSKLVRT
jgi:hypothetical protein